MSQLEQISEIGLDAAINSVGPYAPEYIEDLLPSEDILESAVAREGIIRSLTINAKGRSFDGVRKFDAAHPYTYDAVASAAAEEPRSLKRTNGSSPATFHVGLDFPDRVKDLSGTFDLRKIGLFTMGAVTRTAEVAGSDVLVVHADDEPASLVSSGDIDEVSTLYDTILSGKKPVSYQSAERSGLVGIAEQIQRGISTGEDALFIVSDFQDGYDSESGKFDWEEPILAMGAEFGDRFWPLRITSPSHRELTYGTVKGLDASAVQSMNYAYRERAVAKDIRINQILGSLQKSKSIDMVKKLNEDHPTRMVTQFILQNV